MITEPSAPPIVDASALEHGAPPQAASSLLRDAVWMTVCAAVALGLCAWNLKLWDASLHVPLFGVSGDGNLSVAAVKGLMQTGWVWTNPLLGAPDGMQFYDFPSAFGDTLHLAIMRVLAIGSDDPVAVTNVFYVLTYPLTAAIAFGVLRALGLGRGPAFVGAVLYAMLSFHRARGTGHLALAAYYTVPLACWLILGGMGLHPLFARRAGDARRLRGWLSRRTVATLAIAIVVGLATLYWALGTMILIVVCGLVAALAHRRRSVVLQALVVLAVLFGVTVAQQLPAIVHAQQNGRNAAVADRFAFESEIYGLKLAHLVLPRPGHRIEALSDVGEEYEATAPLPGERFSPNLGIVLAASFVVALLALLALGLRARGPADSLTRRLLVASGVASLLTFLMATVGGGGTVFAYLVSPQLRAWNRMSVFIAFFAVIALGAILTWMLARLQRRGARPVVGAFVIALVGIVGVFDQTSPRDAPAYDDVLSAWRSDARFVAAVDDRMDRGGMVLQLPYVPFPENPPVNRMLDYDQLAGYVHDTKNLRWSYPEIKGRPEDWADDAASLRVPELLASATAAGFTGLWVDRFGYADDGEAVVRQLDRLVGTDERAVSGDGRLLFYPLGRLKRELDATTPAAARTRSGNGLTDPVAIESGAGLLPPESGPIGPVRWVAQNGAIRLANGSSKPRIVVFRTSFRSPTEAPTRRVRITGPRGTRTIVVRPGRPAPYRTVVRLAGDGSAVLRFSASGPPWPDPARVMQLENPTAVDLATVGLGAAVTRTAARP